MDISKMSLALIKEKVKEIRKIQPGFLELMAQDSRAGVRNLYLTCKKRLEAMEKEKERLNALLKYERELWAAGYTLVAGIDEAGRGPLAGPVVAAAVILKQGDLIEGLNDSKKLSPEKRSELEEVIKERAVAYGIGIVSETEIDEMNIYQAALKAMRIAVAKISLKPEYLLVDAVTIPGVSIPQKAIVHGDALSCSIAAASILAKETRDRIMTELDALYPHYGFAQHKGYATAFHLEALKKYGPCPVHRKTFGQVRQNLT
ncbi:Ribonuclease H [Thermincola potens JR]|uniref:Ribonuclease HII n=2 Tax=Thermincola TaxID=278993 RepID=D5X8K9_THEPJ|nr:Ribonuclease H [Thermincola potens JR]